MDKRQPRCHRYIAKSPLWKNVEETKTFFFIRTYDKRDAVLNRLRLLSLRKSMGKVIQFNTTYVG